jgi:hypothetical protein
LKTLGLRVQLGHPATTPCPCPKAAFGDDFVVIDIHGIHAIGLDFCNCESSLPHLIQLLRMRWFPSTVRNPKTAATFQLLEHFHILTFESKASVFEVYHSLARRTDNTGINPPKVVDLIHFEQPETHGLPAQDRYSALLRMVQEWRHLKMLKRSGRGHDPAGVSSTRAGQCTVLCPACPQPGINLPADWAQAPEDKQ